MKDNFFLILGLNANGHNNNQQEYSDQEVKQAYRSLALKYHPDKSEEHSSNNFQKITEAYNILSDPEQKNIFLNELKMNPDAFQQKERQHLYVFFPEEQFEEKHIGSESKYTSALVPYIPGIDLTELIENKGCGSEELLKFVEKKPAMAQILLTANLTIFSLEEKFALFHSWCSHQSVNIDAALIKANPTIYAFLEELRKNETYQLAFINVYSKNKKLPDFFTSDHGLSYLLSFHPKMLYILSQKFFFLIPHFLRIHGKNTKLSFIILLLKLNPATLIQNLNILKKVSGLVSMPVETYFKISYTEKISVLDFFYKYQPLFRRLGTLAIDLGKNQNEKDLLFFLYLAMLGDNISLLEQDEIDNLVRFYFKYLDQKYQEIKLESKNTSNLATFFIKPIILLFSHIRYDNFLFLLKKYLIHPILKNDQIMLFPYVISFKGRDKEAQQPYFLELLIKKDLLIYTCLRANPALLSRLLKVKIYQTALIEDPLLFNMISPIISSNKIHLETPIHDILAEMKFLEKINSQAAAIEELNLSLELPFCQPKPLSLETFNKLYKLTGFYPDLFSLKTDDPIIISRLITDSFAMISVEDLCTVYGNIFYRKIKDLLSINIFNCPDNIKETVEKVIKIIINDSTIKRFFIEKIPTQPVVDMLANLMQMPKIWDALFTGLLLENIISKFYFPQNETIESINFIIGHFLLTGFLTTDDFENKQISPILTDWYKCKNKFDLFALITKLQLQEPSLAQLHLNFHNSKILKFFHLITTQPLQRKLVAFEELQKTSQRIKCPIAFFEYTDYNLFTMLQLINETGLDKGTLDLLTIQLKSYPILLHAVLYELQESYDDLINVEITQEPELFFLRTAITFIKRNTSNISGRKLFRLYSKFGSQLDPYFELYGLEIAKINGQRLDCILSDLEAGLKVTRCHLGDINENIVLQNLIDEFEGLLNTPLKSWATQTPDSSFIFKRQEFYAKLGLAFKRNNSPILKIIIDNYPKNSKNNILLWVLPSVIDGAVFPFIPQIIKIFRDKTFRSTFAFEQICIGIKNYFIQPEKSYRKIIEILGIENSRYIFSIILALQGKLATENQANFFYHLIYQNRLSFRETLALNVQTFTDVCGKVDLLDKEDPIQNEILNKLIQDLQLLPNNPTTPDQKHQSNLPVDFKNRLWSSPKPILPITSSSASSSSSSSSSTLPLGSLRT